MTRTFLHLAVIFAVAAGPLVAQAQAAGDHAPADTHGGAPEAAAEKKSDAAAAEGEEQAEQKPQLWDETPAVEPERQPYILIRGMRAVQDSIAAGSVEAHEQQRKLLRDLGQQMRALPMDVWDDVRNVRAAIYFVLSGGDPAVLKLIIGREQVPAVERRLLKSALAYGEGRVADTLAIMQKMRARDLDPSLGGMVALIQGTLTAKTDAARAIELFDEARLLAPGTLMEEAALRQQIILVARDGDVDKFDLLASQYSRRFPNSLFARNFRQQFFAGVARQNFKRASEWISRTETELNKVPVKERAGLYLAIAEEALKAGNVGIAQFAASKAHELAGAATRAAQRAALYQAAAMVTGPDFEKGLAVLEKIDVPKLSLSDRQIYNSALEVAKTVGRWPDAPQQEPDGAPPESVKRAQAMVHEVDSLLGGSLQ